MDVAPDGARKGSNSVTTNMTPLRSEKKSSLFEFASGITCDTAGEFGSLSAVGAECL
jgi:hypothetical protein